MLDFFRAWRIWSAYEEFGVIPPDAASQLTVMDWLNVFIEVMARMPPSRIRGYLPDDDVQRVTILTRMRDLIANVSTVDTIPWDVPAGWREAWLELGALLGLYMGGETHAGIARRYLELGDAEVSNRRASGSDPIPATLNFFRNVAEGLSMDAGCLLAIQEHLAINQQDEAQEVPDSLKALPLCIRNGCDSLSSISWFRFGFRQRVVAHRLSRLFPLPQEATNDLERMNWILDAQRGWLRDGPQDNDEALLSSIRVIFDAA